MIELFLFAAPGNGLSTAFIGVLGLFIGSFLNVVIYRVPKMMQRESENYVASETGQAIPHQDRFNLMLPGSACPHCGHKITGLENIPVISYLVIGRKCTKCHAPISARYPIIELLTGCLSALMVWHFGSGMTGLAAVLMIWFLIPLTFIDAETQLLPDDLTLPLLWIGLIFNIYGTFTSLENAVIGAICGYLALWSVYWLFKLATGKEGMGYGDFKLLAALGAWMGWSMLPIIILLSSIVGAVIGISMIIFGKLHKNKPIPFGPYLALAGVIALIWGKSMNAQYLGVFL